MTIDGSNLHIAEVCVLARARTSSVSLAAGEDQRNVIPSHCTGVGDLFSQCRAGFSLRGASAPPQA